MLPRWVGREKTLYACIITYYIMREDTIDPIRLIVIRWIYMTLPRVYCEIRHNKYAISY